MLVYRKIYMDKLLKYKDGPLIKVITGMRRCGKSRILELYMNYIAQSGVEEKQILYINFESYEYRSIVSADQLYEYIVDRIDKKNKYYILLDEIQVVVGWERVVNGLNVDFDCDITITGSNAKLLSSELSTLIAGRYVEIPVYPLSFNEFLIFEKEYGIESVSVEVSFNNYIKYGGLPVLFSYFNRDEVFSDVLGGIYNTVLKKDVISFNKVKDVGLLDRVTEYCFENIGGTLSSLKVTNVLKNDGIKTTHNTVINYFKMLEDAFIVYLPKRYDIKGKSVLRTLQKVYVNDIGLRNKVIGFRDIDYGKVLENVIYIELLRRGYGVRVGKYDDLEVDFIASKVDEKVYIQVAYTINDKRTLEREIRVLNRLKDNHRKVIITMDKHLENNIDGIEIIYALDYLCN